MATQRINIRRIEQLDNYHFQIVWSDGVLSTYRLSALQSRCPCAKCVDESTNERRNSAPAVSENVKAKTLQSVGRYALRIQFTEGCSTGIYNYAFLRSLEPSLSANFT